MFMYIFRTKNIMDIWLRNINRKQTTLYGLIVNYPCICSTNNTVLRFGSLYGLYILTLLNNVYIYT